MKIYGAWLGIIFIVFGVLVLVLPDFLRWLIGLFFIVSGIVTIIRK
jgi:uncharacterized membrane protein HdeD (DUF308 family)